MQKLNRKTKDLVEATLIIGIARGEGINNSSHDEKKDKIKGSIDNLTNRQIEITKQTAIDFNWRKISHHKKLLYGLRMDNNLVFYYTMNNYLKSLKSNTQKH